MTPAEAKSKYDELIQEEVSLYQEREGLTDQVKAMTENIQRINSRLLTLRAAREGYMLGQLSVPTTVTEK